MSYKFLESIQPSITSLAYPSELPGMLSVRQSVEGYKDDQVGPHPIHSSLPFISLSPSYFDGIIYQKGSQVLKQLNLLMGNTNFYNSLRSYLQTN